MSEWQPIETAPRDGTFVLLFLPHIETVRTGYWSHMTGKGWMINWASTYRTSVDGPVTHWQPLPDPPAESAPAS